MRVLVTCVSGYGHLQPLLPLSGELAHAGHDVAIATGPELRGRAEAAGFDAFVCGLDTGPAFERLAEQFPHQPYTRLAPDEILGWFLPHLFGEIFAPAMLDDLEPVLRRWRPDIVLHDAWEFAGPLAAAAVGIPSVSQTLGLRTDDRILDSVGAAVAPLWRDRGLDPDPTAGVYRHLCLDISPPSLRQPASAADRDVIRPLRPVASAPVSGEALPAWIQGRRDVPLVHMTLGTNTNSNLSAFASVIEGLGAAGELDVLITVGFGTDPDSFGALPPNVHVQDYVPQSLLLPHCSAVICHGGAGTTLSSLAAGLPLLILPQGADQYVIADLVVAAEAGLSLAPAEVSATSVRGSVSALLADPTYRAAALRLREEIQNMPSPRETVPVVEAVAQGTAPAERLPADG
jgi:UDP:flavonoid glycosyltransferase YjiC (YdhE family)